MKGIVLAGGTGSRLWPITRSVSKQLLPVYDKPMIYYPISTLMLAGIREILIITTPQDQLAFKELLGDGSNFGVFLSYATQEKPEGLAQAFIIGQEFIGQDSVALILGDNIFHGKGLGRELQTSFSGSGGHIFTYEVSDPSRYGVLTLNEDGEPESIYEKPEFPNSNLAVTGLYFFDNHVSEIVKHIVPSSRGELEITSIIQNYIDFRQLNFTRLSRGAAWLDTGTTDSLLDASNYIRILEQRTGLNIGCLEEIALSQDWISLSTLKDLVAKKGNSSYYTYVAGILKSQSDSINNN